MFVPQHFRTHDGRWAIRIIHDHPLATLVTNGDPAPFATRLPALPAPNDRPDAPLIGTKLLCHMNRANPHWARLADGTVSRLMFDGPQGYVTPAIYPPGPAAPTWNFTSVHLNGRIRLLRTPQETLEVVRFTAARLEAQFGRGWEATPSLDYFQRILPGVGAFQFQVEAVETMYKLSQDQSPEVQELVIRHYEADSTGNYRGLARLMRDYGLGETVPAGGAAEAAER